MSNQADGQDITKNNNLVLRGAEQNSSEQVSSFNYKKYQVSSGISSSNRPSLVENYQVDGERNDPRMTTEPQLRVNNLDQID